MEYLERDHRERKLKLTFEHTVSKMGSHRRDTPTEVLSIIGPDPDPDPVSSTILVTLS